MTYPNLTFSTKTPRKTRKPKKQAPEEVPVQTGLIATDGKTPIPPEVKRRGEAIEVIGSIKLMRDPETNLTWCEGIG
jgi:hypothetical protein